MDGILRPGHVLPTYSQCLLISVAAGAVIQAVTMATKCVESDDGELSTSVQIGELIGAILWMIVADAVGRKEASCLACVVSAAACGSVAFAASPGIMRLSCIFAGGGSIGSTTLGPILLVIERSPANRRGKDVLSLFLALTLGAALAVLLRFAVEQWWTVLLQGSGWSVDAASWRTVCALVSILPFGIGISASGRMDESIRWLVAKRRFGAARAQLVRKRRTIGLVTPAERASAVAAFDRLVIRLGSDLSCTSSGGMHSWTLSHIVPCLSKKRLHECAARATPFCRAASVCALGLAFLASFGYACIVSVVRLEYDDTSNRNSNLACPELDASLVWRALLAQALAIFLARHLVESIGRRPTIAAACAVAATGVLCVAGPSYFPNLIQINDARQLLFAVLISRGALIAALAVIALLLIETHAASARAPAAAAFAILSTLASLLAEQWVIAPNPVATVALLLTLVDVSAAWAALALPIESAGHPIDTLIALNPLDAAAALKQAERPATLLGIADLFELDFATVTAAARLPSETQSSPQEEAASFSHTSFNGVTERESPSVQESKHNNDNYQNGAEESPLIVPTAAEDTPLLSHAYFSSNTAAFSSSLLNNNNIAGSVE